MATLLRFIVPCIGKLPLPVRALIGRTLGWLFSWVPTRDRRIAQLHMDRFIKDEGGSKHIHRMYASLGETLLESMNLKPILDNYQKYISADWPQWDEILSRKKGVLIIAAHTGNWDLLAASSICHGFKVSVVGKAAKSPLFQDALNLIRKNYGAEAIWRAGSSGMKQIIEAFKRGEAAAAVIDQDTNVSSSMIPFFGVPAATPSTIIELARRYDAVIIAPLIFRTGINKYTIYVKELDNKLPLDEILLQFNKYLEDMIRRYPWQWVWLHKRWRTLADGRRLSGKEYLAYLERGMVA